MTNQEAYQHHMNEARDARMSIMCWKQTLKTSQNKTNIARVIYGLKVHHRAHLADAKFYRTGSYS